MTQVSQDLPFKMLGLTGGIASGKSTIGRRMKALGLPVIDADVVAREVVAPGSPGLAAVVEAFGQEVLQADGQLDRAALGARVFGDDAARRRLNGILHPLIGARTAWLANQHREAGSPLVVYEAPLIVENGLHHGLDMLIVVGLDPETQRARLMARDDLDAQAAQARIDAQLPLADKIAVADVVIDNSGDTRAALTQLDDLLSSLPERLWAERAPEARAGLERWMAAHAQETP